MNKISSSVDFYLGQTYHRNLESYKKLHELVETYYIAFSFAVFTAAYCVTLPFMKLYTEGITDAEYKDVWLPFLFVVIELLSSIRSVSAKLINISGNAPNTRWNTIAEATLTLVSSLILVQFLGLRGVLLGMIISALYRVNDILIFVNHKVLRRKHCKIYSMVIINFVFFAMFAVVNTWLEVRIKSYLHFALYGLVTLGCTCAVFLVVNSLIRRDLCAILWRIVTSRMKKK